MGQVTSTHESVTCSLGSPTSVYWSNQVQSKMCQTVNNCENLLLIFGQKFSILCQQERAILNTILIRHCFCALKQQYIETECPADRKHLQFWNVITLEPESSVCISISGWSAANVFNTVAASPPQRDRSLLMVAQRNGSAITQRLPVSQQVADQ